MVELPSCGNPEEGAVEAQPIGLPSNRLQTTPPWTTAWMRPPRTMRWCFLFRSMGWFAKYGRSAFCSLLSCDVKGRHNLTTQGWTKLGTHAHSNPSVFKTTTVFSHKYGLIVLLRRRLGFATCYADEYSDLHIGWRTAVPVPGKLKMTNFLQGIFVHCQPTCVCWQRELESKAMNWHCVGGKLVSVE